MTEDLDKKLCEKYPKIFKMRNASMQETCMCWGFEHGNGWYDIIDSACKNIQHHVDWKRKQSSYDVMTQEEFDEEHQPVAVQVKEKFGGLRFYVDNCDDYVRGVISMAETMSYKTCEECGSHGAKRSGAWVRTLCDGCNKK
jgi:hypothetical protein